MSLISWIARSRRAMTKASTTTDSIYANLHAKINNFIFDEKVANVFSDMIKRSVPGYDLTISMIGALANQYAQENSFCYDLGCSLGTATFAMQSFIDKPGCRIIAVDNSQAMVDCCRQNISKIDSEVPIDVVCSDICDIKIQNASVIVLNFTLQFIDLDKREELLRRIYEGLLPGGIVIISEKIVVENKQEQNFYIQMHHAFKELNGYSKLEIEQKRTALEKVLVPETLAAHKERLKNVGFEEVVVWFQCLNFVSMCGRKFRPVLH